ncbi:hypothetical protein [Paenibacillus turpanensis]|uniref:hypothetical protein n=1 Tax=Paenibacillus turpanensis TaxID=2689078 RepID=UPI00140C8554|nr:hypothetical protein [Paenibacillus turpanensis]
MKWIEWTIAIGLVLLGLSCLTMSATMMAPSGGQYWSNFVQICTLIVMPLVIIGLILIILKRKKGDPK